MVVHLKVDYNVIIARLSGRRQCPNCGALYSLSSNSPAVSEVCDYDGSKLLVRDDDREEVVVERLKRYDLETAPVLEFLCGAGYRCYDVEGEGRAPQAIAREIRELIEKEFAGSTGKSGMIVRKNMAELEKMRAAGLLVWQILDKLKGMAREGLTTYELEVEAEKMMGDAGARPAFKGYSTPAAGTKFPFVLCTSVNDEIVHGMPSQKRALKPGDIVSIDTGVQLNGYYGDSAVTVPIGEISEETRRLLEVTRESLELAIDKARPGNRLFDICGTVERHVTASGFTVVREFVGHGIGTHMHEEPQIPELHRPQE